jgi:formylglycine-generating enzyme required for sulfatase activity
MTARAFEARYCQATITRGFWLGQTPVTQEAYQRVIGNNSSYLIGPRLPVETVSWDEAQAYCKGNRNAATHGSRMGVYRSRGLQQPHGMATWTRSPGTRATAAVRLIQAAQKKQNAFKLYDMLGNVWERVSDWYGEKYYAESPRTDPSGPSSSEYRVLRGGSWGNKARNACASLRDSDGPTVRFDTFGFRCAGELRPLQ